MWLICKWQVAEHTVSLVSQSNPSLDGGFKAGLTSGWCYDEAIIQRLMLAFITLAAKHINHILILLNYNNLGVLDIDRTVDKSLIIVEFP